MGVLLSPGIRVLSQFGFARKFALLLVLFILPLAVSLWLLGADFQAKLATVSGERSGVRLLQRLDAVEEELTLRRNLTARWKAIDTSRQETPAVQAAIAALESRNDSRRERLALLEQQLGIEGAGADVQARFKTLQQALAGLEVADLRGLGWWPDGYDRFTAALGAVQALREEIALDSGLILDPWMETYLLMQIGTTQSVELYDAWAAWPASARPVWSPASSACRAACSCATCARASATPAKAWPRWRPARQQAARRTWRAGRTTTRRSAASWTPVSRPLIRGVFGGEITLRPEQFEATLDGVLQGLQTFRQFLTCE